MQSFIARQRRSTRNLLLFCSNRKFCLRFEEIFCDEIKSKSESWVKQFTRADNQMIKELLDNQKLVEAERLKKELEETQKSPTTRTCSLFVQYYTSQKQIDKAKSIIDDYKNDGVLLTTAPYSILLDYFIALNDESNILDIIKEMGHDIEFDSNIFTKLLDFFIKQNNHQLVVDTWDKIQTHYESKDLSISTSVYNKMIEYYTSVKDSQNIENILDTMIHKNITPTEATYSLCFKYFESNSPDKIDDMVNIITQIHPPISFKVYSYIIKYYGSINNLERVQYIENIMEQNNIPTDSGVYKGMLRAFLNNNELKKALDLLKTITKSKRYVFTTEWYAPFIRFLLRNGDLKSIEYIQKEVADNNIPFEITYCNALASVFVSTSNSTSNIKDLLKKMKDKGIEPNDITKKTIQEHGMSHLLEEYYSENKNINSDNLASKILNNFLN